MKKNSLWEVGSEFHWPDLKLFKYDSSPWDKSYTYYFGSGRDALRAIVRYLKKLDNNITLWIPDYFCHEVTYALYKEGINISFYRLDPYKMRADIKFQKIRKNDAILLFNLFGLYFFDEYKQIPDDVIVIEDHTHDPWSYYAFNSKAHFCVASLRKTLPITCGVIWTNKKIEEFGLYNLTQTRQQAIYEKLSAAIIKAFYLKGLKGLKKIYRSLQINAEKKLGKGNISGTISWVEYLIKAFPVFEWREKRKRNYFSFIRYSSHNIKEKIILPIEIDKTCPFMIVMVCKTNKERESIRKKLIKENIYPAVLWSQERGQIDEISEISYSFSKKMLAIHCDWRYSRADMKIAAGIIKDVLENVSKHH